MMEKPRLIYEFAISRRHDVRRFFWNLLAAVAAFGAWVALDAVPSRTDADIDPLLLRVGEIVALGVTALFAVRAFFNLLRALRRRNESGRIFDRGFTWSRGVGKRKTEEKYAWTQVKTFREGVRTIRIGRLVLAQRGAHVLTMRDGEVYKFTAAKGNPHAFVKAVRPYVSDVIGERMARSLREGKTIRVHPQLAVSPKGIMAGDEKIRWSELDVDVKGGTLSIKKLDKNGKFKRVKAFPLTQMDNVGGFMEIANMTIRNHQPQRFNIKTQGTGY